MQRKFMFGLLFGLLAAAWAPLAAHAADDDKRCTVSAWEFMHDQTVPVSLSMPNDKKPCKIRKITLQGGNVAKYTLAKPPANGAVEIKKNEALYTPKAGFAGTDNFVLAIAGKNPYAKPPMRTGKLEVTVKVGAP